MRVLIAEDEYLLASDLAAMLAEYGHVVTAVPSATAAISAATKVPLDLAILDVQLGPGSLDGLAVARRLGSIGVPVVFFSGVDLDEDSVRSLAVGHVPKCFGCRAVADVVCWFDERMSGGRPPVPSCLVYGPVW
jgi:DNA-binding response OmpR family regulator